MRINFYIATPPTYWSDVDETASLVSWNTLDCLRPHAGENRREREPTMDSDGGGNGRRGRAGNPRRESSNLVPSRLEVCKNKRDVRATCPMRRRSPRYLAISAGAVLAATASRSCCGLEESVEPRHESLQLKERWSNELQERHQSRHHLGAHNFLLKVKANRGLSLPLSV